MRVSFWVVPLLVVLAAAGGILSDTLVEAPTVVREYPGPKVAGEPAVVLFKVRGLKCTDTAKTFSRQFEGLPGVVKLEAFASTHRARIAYDPGATSPEALREAAEGPVVDPASGAIDFGVFEVLEVDGTPVGTAGDSR